MLYILSTLGEKTQLKSGHINGKHKISLKSGKEKFPYHLILYFKLIHERRNGKNLMTLPLLLRL